MSYNHRSHGHFFLSLFLCCTLNLESISHIQRIKLSIQLHFHWIFIAWNSNFINHCSSRSILHSFLHSTLNWNCHALSQFSGLPLSSRTFFNTSFHLWQKGGSKARSDVSQAGPETERLPMVTLGHGHATKKLSIKPTAQVLFKIPTWAG